MIGTYKIIWSVKSSIDVDSIIDYLKIEWTEAEIKAFLLRLKDVEDVVSTFPKLYPESKSSKGLRKAVISKNNSIVYTINHGTINVVTVIDNRSNKKY